MEREMGMERGIKERKRDKRKSDRQFNLSSRQLNSSIPAKAGISFSRQREFSAKRNIAMFAFGECGCAAEIPAFAGMEGGGRRF